MRNRILVSLGKRPVRFFTGLAKKLLMSEEEVELTGLGFAIGTVVTLAELLKSSNHAILSDIKTSLVNVRTDGRKGPLKAKIQIWIRKSASFFKLISSMTHIQRFPYGRRGSRSYCGRYGSDRSGRLEAPRVLDVLPNSLSINTAVQTTSSHTASVVAAIASSSAVAPGTVLKSD
eukprot:IDg4165t1